MLKKKLSTAASDQDLIHGCREGRPDAWERLLSKYERLVFSVPVRYGLSDDDAADVTQLTFASLIQTLDWTGCGRIAAWERGSSPWHAVTPGACWTATVAKPPLRA